MINFKNKNYLGFVAVLSFVMGDMVAVGNVIGIDAQNFNATTNGLDFVTVQSSETLSPCVLNLGLFINHAKNTLPIFYQVSRSKDHQDYVTGADLSVGFGLAKNWDIGLSLPQILAQKVDSEQYRGEFEAKGNTEVRLNSKLRLFGDNRGGFALVGTASVNRLNNNPFAGQDAGPTATLEAAADTTVNRFALAANLGYRWRNPGEPLADFPVVPYKDQYIYSVAASYHFSRINTKLITEIFGSRPVKAVSSALTKSQSSLEFLTGIKHDISQNVALHVGGGRRLSDGVASPDLRVYGGLNVTIGPMCSENSKIPPKPPAATKKSTVLASLPKSETIILHNVNFVFDSYKEVLPGTKIELKKLADYLESGFDTLSIEGHTDSMGSDEYNKVLSDNRAATIRRYLVEIYKLDPKKITSVGYGESRPVADNGNYQGRQENRRVEFKIRRK